MKYFTDNGTFLIGKHKERPYTALPKSYVKWAKENLKGFTMEYEWLLLTKPSPPLAGKSQWKSSCGNGTISNKTLRPPQPNRFKSRSKRIVGATLHKPDPFNY